MVVDRADRRDESRLSPTTTTTTDDERRRRRGGREEAEESRKDEENENDNGDQAPVSGLWETAISIGHCAWKPEERFESSWSRASPGIASPCLPSTLVVISHPQVPQLAVLSHLFRFARRCLDDIGRRSRAGARDKIIPLTMRANSRSPPRSILHYRETFPVAVSSQSSFPLRPRLLRRGNGFFARFSSRSERYYLAFACRQDDNVLEKCLSSRCI